MPSSSAGFSFAGDAVSDLFGAVGSLQSAKGYKQAAAFSRQNEQLSKESTAIQQYQMQRKLYMTLGGQQADIAGANLANSGSALDLMRSSAQQGALTKQLLTVQGTINALGYEAEAANYSAMAKAANTKAVGGFLGTGIAAAAAFVAFSDDRLKTGMVRVGERPDGLGIYEFGYRGSTSRFRGVSADEVARVYPSAVSWEDGFRKVDYEVIGVVPEVV